MKRCARVVVLTALPLFLMGCASPKVQYHETDDMNRSYIPFALLASRVTIALPDKAADGQKSGEKGNALVIGKPQKGPDKHLQDAIIVVTPTQAKGTLRYLEPEEGFLQLSKTNISITYFDGMKVPKTVGVFVEDNTVKLITALGAVGGALGTIMAALPSKVEITPEENKIALPIVLDFSDPEDFSTYGPKPCKPIGEPNEGYGYCYTLAEREGRKTKNDKQEMVTYKGFFKDYDGKATRNVPFSRCVDLTVVIKRWNKENKTAVGKELATYNAVIADPYHIDWLPLPQKGSITSQGICEANSTTEKSDNPSAFDIIEAVGKQVDSLWKAWHPAKNE